MVSSYYHEHMHSIVYLIVGMGSALTIVANTGLVIKVRNHTMTNLFYTTIDNDLTGRASHFYRTEGGAQFVCGDQNARAEGLNIKARYEVVEVSEEGIESKDIRK